MANRRRSIVSCYLVWAARDHSAASPLAARHIAFSTQEGEQLTAPGNDRP